MCVCRKVSACLKCVFALAIDFSLNLVTSSYKYVALKKDEKADPFLRFKLEALYGVK